MWLRRFSRSPYGFHPRVVYLAISATILGYGCNPPNNRKIVAVRTDWSEAGVTGRQLATDHFDIMSTLTDAELEDALPTFLEAAYGEYESVLPVADRDYARLASYVFAMRSQWMRFTRRRFPDRFSLYALIPTGGYTENGTSVSFNIGRSSTLATIAHEGWHQYVGTRIEDPMPAWLNEGIACCFESFHFTNIVPKFTPERNTFRINGLREALQQDRVIPLSDLVTTDAGSVIQREHRQFTRIYYAQAWALVNFLRHGDGGRHARSFDKLLSDIADGSYRVRLSAGRLGTGTPKGVRPSDLAFETYFGCRPETLMETYYDYIVRICAY